MMLLLAALAIGVVTVQGYVAERGGEKLNVHLVCHTHDDAGWLKVYQYVRLPYEYSVFIH